MSIESLGDRLLVDVETAVGATGGQTEAVAALVETTVAFVVADPAGGRLLFAESLAGGQPSLRLREELARKSEALIETAWARAPREEAVVRASVDLNKMGQ
ncbi:MAG TPA: hypothetical protein VGO13_07515 [Solirubrobacterales bacterium]|nr:hypothetical protein [Solirubrobacterales bacterium]